MRFRAALSLVLWVCLAGAGLADLTFPALTGRVVDDAGLLAPADRADLTASLAALEAKTSDQLVVVTLKSLQGTAIEDYGYQLGRAWGIGQKGKNSGALLIVAPVERKVRVEVGYGLEGTLTDAATKVIIEGTILPRFKAGDFPGGIKQGTANLIALLEGDAAASAAAPDTAATSPQGSDTLDGGTPAWPVIGLGLVLVAVLILCAITGGALCRGLSQLLLLLALSGGRGGGGGGGRGFSGGGGSFGGGGSSGSW